MEDLLLAPPLTRRARASRCLGERNLVLPFPEEHAAAPSMGEGQADRRAEANRRRRTVATGCALGDPDMLKGPDQVGGQTVRTTEERQQQALDAALPHHSSFYVSCRRRTCCVMMEEKGMRSEPIASLFTDLWVICRSWC